MSPPVVYMAHPVSGDVDGNLARARTWVRYLVEATDWAVCVPWMPYVETIDETTGRERGLRDDIAMLGRCDAIVLVGGRVSRGMQVELDHANTLRLTVVDLTSLGAMPPTTDIASVLRSIRITPREDY